MGGWGRVMEGWGWREMGGWGRKMGGWGRVMEGWGREMGGRIGRGGDRRIGGDRIPHFLFLKTEHSKIEKMILAKNLLNLINKYNVLKMCFKNKKISRAIYL